MQIFFFCSKLSIIICFFSIFILEPNDLSKVNIVSISLTLGKFLRITFLLDNKVAAKIGKDAFLEPDILICPLSFFAPKTSNFCMIKL